MYFFSLWLFILVSVWKNRILNAFYLPHFFDINHPFCPIYILFKFYPKVTLNLNLAIGQPTIIEYYDDDKVNNDFYVGKSMRGFIHLNF